MGDLAVLDHYARNKKAHIRITYPNKLNKTHETTFHPLKPKQTDRILHISEELYKEIQALYVWLESDKVSQSGDQQKLVAEFIKQYFNIMKLMQAHKDSPLDPVAIYPGILMERIADLKKGWLVSEQILDRYCQLKCWNNYCKESDRTRDEFITALKRENSVVSGLAAKYKADGFQKNVGKRCGPKYHAAVVAVKQRECNLRPPYKEALVGIYKHLLSNHIK